MVKKTLPLLFTALLSTASVHASEGEGNLITLMGRRLRTSNRLLSDEQHARESL